MNICNRYCHRYVRKVEKPARELKNAINVEWSTYQEEGRNQK